MILGLSIFIAAMSTQSSQLIPVLTLGTDQCPAAVRDHDRGWRGDRAIFNEDGTAVVAQCGDGTVLYWREGEDRAEVLGEVPLFRAAQQVGLIPGHVRCLWPFEGLEGEADCEILDRTLDGRTFVIENSDVLDQYVTSDAGIGHLLDGFHRAGVVLPRTGSATEIVAVNDGRRPAELISIDLTDGSISTIATLPSRNLIFEDDEGRASKVAYSDAHDLIVISYSGVFRVAEEMTYLRALTLDGEVKWELRNRLPEREPNGFTDDVTQMFVFDGGRHAVLGRISRRYRSDVIDLATGYLVGQVPGWPIAASTRADRIMFKTEAGALVVAGWRAGESGRAGN